MSSEVASSILDFVQTGTYPDSESVISSELSAASIALAIDAIEKAKQDLNVTYPFYAHNAPLN
jgi:hypothetical protein